MTMPQSIALNVCKDLVHSFIAGIYIAPLQGGLLRGAVNIVVNNVYGCSVDGLIDVDLKFKRNLFFFTFAVYCLKTVTRNRPWSSLIMF